MWHRRGAAGTHHPRPGYKHPTRDRATASPRRARPPSGGLHLPLAALLPGIHFHIASGAERFNYSFQILFCPSPSAHPDLTGAQTELSTRVGSLWDLSRCRPRSGCRGAAGACFSPTEEPHPEGTSCRLRGSSARTRGSPAPGLAAAKFLLQYLILKKVLEIKKETQAAADIASCYGKRNYAGKKAGKKTPMQRKSESQC